MEKTVLITGAAGNLGQAAVKRFLDDGWFVVATLAPGEKLDISHEKLLKHEVNLFNEDEAAKCVRTTINTRRSIDAALLLVGGFAMGKVEETGKEQLDRMYRLNFETAYFCARPLLKQMKAQKNGGQIVLVGTRPGLNPAEGAAMAAYTLSKSLIFSLADILNKDGEEHGVTTSVIVPSTIDTPQNRKSMPDADFDEWVTPESLANVLAFACSEEAGDLRQTIFKVYGDS